MWTFELPLVNTLSTETEEENKKFGVISVLKIQYGSQNWFCVFPIMKTQWGERFVNYSKNL